MQILAIFRCAIGGSINGPLYALQRYLHSRFVKTSRVHAFREGGGGISLLSREMNKMNLLVRANI